MKKLILLLIASMLLIPGVRAESFDEKVLEVIKKNPQVIKESLEKYEQEAASRKEDDEFKQLLKDKVTVDIGKSPIHGDKKAKYTIIAFSDFQCPFCKRGDDTIKALEKKYGKDLRYVFKHFPLGFHPEARPASKALWAAGEQGKFYEYHDKLWENQRELGDATYLKLAEELKLDIEKFNKDRNSDAAEEQIKEDVKAGEAIGIRGTPGFIVNGVKVLGAYPVEHFEKVINALDKE